MTGVDAAANRRLQTLLHQVLSELVDDPRFRTELLHDAPGALARRGLGHPGTPSRLSVPERIDVTLSTSYLFPRAPAALPPLDVRLVAYGAKPAALAFGDSTTIAGWAGWAVDHGLVAVGTNNRYLGQPVSGFQHRSHPLPRWTGHHVGQRGLVVSQTVEEAALAWLSTMFTWHVMLGRVLGYPACCTEHFERLWPDASDGDLALRLAGAPGGRLDWRLNVFARQAGVRLLYHFPCDPQCPASTAQADRFTLRLSRHEPDTLHALKHLLTQPVAYSSTQGVSLLEGGGVDFSDADVRYVPTRARHSAADAALCLAVARHDAATDTARGIEFAGRALPGSRLMQFS